MSASEQINSFYSALLSHFGPCNWWPGDSPFEVAVGAILTQNTNWKNVEKALLNLKAQGSLTPRAIWDMPEAELAEALRPSGFFTLKAKRLRNLLACFAELAEDTSPPADPALSFLQGYSLEFLREKLLAVKGIGPETADSVLLYALNRPVFVVDAYTYRFLNRHSLITEDACYADMQELFMSALPEDVAMFNEYHALIVRLGQFFCRKSNPLCANCPLGIFL